MSDTDSPGMGTVQQTALDKVLALANALGDRLWNASADNARLKSGNGMVAGYRRIEGGRNEYVAPHHEGLRDHLQAASAAGGHGLHAYQMAANDQTLAQWHDAAHAGALKYQVPAHAHGEALEKIKARVASRQDRDRAAFEAAEARGRSYERAFPAGDRKRR